MSPEPATHRYFAYGSNLHRPQMASLAPSAVPVGLARLPGWELFVNDHGVLSIRPRPGDDGHGSAGLASEVLGLVWRCATADLDTLDRFEAVDEGLYLRFVVSVEPFDGGRHPGGPPPDDGGPCFVYRSVSSLSGRPRPGYLEGSVLPPMRDLGLPGPYLEQVERLLAHGTSGPRWNPVPARGDVFTTEE